MKKIFYFLCFSTLVFASCDGDDDTTPYDPDAIQSTTLLKKMVQTFDIGAPLTVNFNYNGFKIANYTDTDGGSAIFTYSGNQITKIEYFEGVVLKNTELFTYNAQNLVSSYKLLQHEEDYGMRREFTHNGTGTVTFTTFFGTVAEQNIEDANGKLFFANGEIIKMEMYVGSDTLFSETYQYDTWNNPFKNVIGLNEASAYSGEINGIKRNVVTTSGTTNPRSVTYQYDLNSRFPISSVEVSALDEEIQTQYLYE